MRSKGNVLSKREAQIMEILFTEREATVAEVIAAMGEEVAYNSIRNLMTGMEKKGYLYHREENGRYIYLPTESRAIAAREALQRLVKTFFRGSMDDAVEMLLSEEDIQLSKDSIERIESMIHEAKTKESLRD
jgi:BlaI family transcriptional regulator, penicillinase repressor